jgi:hypothetical protein
VEPAAARRVVEESLGDAVIRGIDDFVFRDIEDEATALDVFSFVADPQIRTVLAASLRGARWQQKVGLVLARHKGHPAHVAQIRSQVIEYGAITELLLRRWFARSGQGACPPHSRPSSNAPSPPASSMSEVWPQPTDSGTVAIASTTTPTPDRSRSAMPPPH